MEQFDLTQKQYDALVRKLDELNQRMNFTKENPELEGDYINNQELMSLLQVSKSTTQRWRDTGRLPFYKFEKKIYYRTDIILNTFKISHNTTTGMEHPSPEDPNPDEFTLLTACRKCPLYVILNS